MTLHQDRMTNMSQDMMKHKDPTGHNAHLKKYSQHKISNKYNNYNNNLKMRQVWDLHP